MIEKRGLGAGSRSEGPTLPAAVPDLVRFRANLAHARQPRPDSGLGFQVRFLSLHPLRTLKTFWQYIGEISQRAPSSSAEPMLPSSKRSTSRCADFIRTSICDKYSVSMNITSHMDHIRHCKTASGTNWSNGWTHRVCIINTRRDQIPS